MMAQNKTDNIVRGRVQVTTTIQTSSAERAVDVVEDLKEWLDDGGLKSWSVRRALGDVIVISSYRAEEMHNGTLSALAAATAELDKALSEITRFRWFNDNKSVAKFIEGRDEVEDEPEEGDDDQDDD